MNKSTKVTYDGIDSDLINFFILSMIRIIMIRANRKPHGMSELTTSWYLNFYKGSLTFYKKMQSKPDLKSVGNSDT